MLRLRSLLLVLTVLATVGCRDSPEPAGVSVRQLAQGATYFRTADIDAIPPTFADETSFDVARDLPAAFVARADEAGRIVTLETMERGQTVALRRYYYAPNGALLRRDTIGDDGTVRMDSYKPDGTLDRTAVHSIDRDSVDAPGNSQD